MIGGQRIQVGLPHVGKTAEITIEADTYQITVEEGIALTTPRTTSGTSNGTRLITTQTATGTMPSTSPQGAPPARRTYWREAPAPPATAQWPHA